MKSHLDLYFRCLDLFLGVRTYIFECPDLYFGCLRPYFGCLDLYFRCLDLFSGFWTYIWVSGLIYWVSELILWVSGSGRVGRVGRAAGSGEFSVWGKSILGICIGKKVSIDYIIEFWTWGIFTKKTRAEKCCILACCMRRDLSYETHLGPKTKTD